ncbi:MAG: gliding motility-associated ABC transporter substrate-binding protein GldG [Chitinophagaceae bacterium]
MIKLLDKQYTWMYIILSIVLINIGVFFFHARFDLTSNKIYSFTPATKNLLKNLDNEINIEVFLDGGVKNLDKKLSNILKESLQEYRALSKGKIHFEFINPFRESLSDNQRNQLLDTLQQLGLQPYTLQAQTKSNVEVKKRLILPGIIIKIGDQIKAINLFEGLQLGEENELFHQASLMLEYRISTTIKELIKNQRANISYLIGHGEPLDIRMAEFFTLLGQKYNIDTLNLSYKNDVPKSTDLLIIFSPYAPFSDNEKMKIDQYIMNGGKIFWAINTMQVDNTKESTLGNLLFINQDVNLDDMMFRYGVKLNYSLVKDLQCATISVVVGQVGNKPQIKPLQWPYYPLLNTNPNHIITKGLDPLLAKYTTFLDTITVPHVTKEPLAYSSSKSQLISAPALVSINEASLLNPNFYTKQFLPIAILLQGNFPSLYYNRMTEQDRTYIEQTTQQPFPKISQSTHMVVVANPAMFVNEVSQQKIIPIGFSKDMNYMFANQSFLLNTIEYLLDDKGLIVARNKNFKQYLLNADKVHNEKLFFQAINILAPIILLVIIGFVFNYLRKRQNTH